MAAKASRTGELERWSGLQVRNLLYNIDTIGACIESDKDLLALTNRLFEKRLIPETLREEFSLMHESVPHATKCRYLLWSVYNTIRKTSNGSDGIESFLVVLSESPVGRKVAYNYYKKKHWFGSIGFKNKTTKICELLKEMFRTTDSSNNDSRDYPNSIHQPKLSSICVNEEDNPFIVLLEAEIAAYKLESNLGQWSKNSESLRIFSPVLCVLIADVTAEGTYRYYVNEMVHTTLVLHLNSRIDRFSLALVYRYQRDDIGMADKDAWPRVNPTSYINLAVIKTERLNEINTYISNTIQGDADDIYKVKGETSYKEIFEVPKYGEVVIIEGRPGCGKTTLLHKISKDWANTMSQENSTLRNIKALFLIHLRGFRGNPNIELVDLVKRFYSNSQTIEVICEYINLKEGAGICFLLDGLNEYQPTNRDNFIFNLIEKKIISKSIVIVASRPLAVAKYRSTNKHFEVLGFFKQQIFEYIDRYNFSNNSLHRKSMLKQYLEERPNVYHMCYLPLQLAMVCFLFDRNGTLPDTETAIYAEFTKHTILRSLYRLSENSKWYIESIFALPEQKKSDFLNICALAFDKTFSSKQVLEQFEVDFVSGNLKSSFGLLTIDRACTKCGFQNLYTFSHLTLQEFLAACYIFMAEMQRQLKLIEISKREKHMLGVLKFFCGLTNFVPEGILFKKVTDSEHFNCLTKIHCAYESQQAVTCNYVADNNCLSTEECFLSARDYTALGFVLINAEINCVKKLNLTKSGITMEGLDALIKQTQGREEKLKVEVLNISEITNRMLLCFTNNFRSLSIISISVNVGLDNMISFFGEVKYPSLKVISFLESQKPVLIAKLNSMKLLQSLVPSSLNIVKATTCGSTLFNIIYSGLSKQSDLFVQELTEMCSNLCLLTSFAKITIRNIDSDEITIVKGNRFLIDIDQEIASIAKKNSRPFYV